MIRRWLGIATPFLLQPLTSLYSRKHELEADRLGVAYDPAVMRVATERGVPIAEIKRKSGVGRDIDALDAGIAAALGWER